MPTAKTPSALFVIRVGTANELTERQRGALVAYIETNGGVSTHGNVAKALARRGLATDLDTGFGGGTTFRLTDEGRAVAYAAAAREYREREEKARAFGNAQRAQMWATKAVKAYEAAEAIR